MNPLEQLRVVALSDAHIQWISGQESKKSLEVDQHLSPDAVGDAYQGGVQDFGL
jgi:hypothetical protein